MICLCRTGDIGFVGARGGVEVCMVGATWDYEKCCLTEKE
jgi:hypothetical protein